MSAAHPDDPPALAAARAALWAELGRAVADKAHPWRTAVLATVGGAAGVAARVVVLREVDAAAGELVFFTDARSPKVAQATDRPDAVLVLWSQPLGWQLRLQVALGIETGGLAVSSRWARLKMTPAAQDYLSPLPPGTPLDPHAAPERGSRGHFAVVTAQVRAMDWLALDAAGYRRAVFDDDGARWVQP